MILPQTKVLSVVAIFFIATQVSKSQPEKQDDVCFSCTGTTYFHPNRSAGEKLLNNQTEAFCFNKKTKQISLLTGGVYSGGYSLTKHIPETEWSPAYYHWLSKVPAKWLSYDENLYVFVEFAEVSQTLQVVKRTESQNPKIAFNGLCRETRRFSP